MVAVNRRGRISGLKDASDQPLHVHPENGFVRMLKCVPSCLDLPWVEISSFTPD